MKIYFILFLFLFHLSFSQTVKVEYDLNIDLSGTSQIPFKHKLELSNSQGKSLVKKYFVPNTSNNVLDKNKELTKVVKIGNDTTYFYKDFEQNRMFSEEKIFINMFKVKDNLNLFDWTIESDTLTVLGYKCNRATTKFRGREFEVYFTSEIPISDGPAKYNGLPGLILKVSILNSTSIYSIVATKIDLNNQNSELKNPFEDKKCIEFEAYKKKYLQKMGEMDSFNTNQGVTVGKSGLELLIDG